MTSPAQDVINNLRARAWRLQGDARAIYRLVSHISFAEVIEKVTDEERKEAFRLIEECNHAALDSWFKKHDLGLTKEDLVTEALKLGIPRASRMPKALLKKELDEYKLSRKRSGVNGQGAEHALGIGVQPRIQSQEAGSS